MSLPDASSSRRDFLTGKVVREAAQRAGERVAEGLAERRVPSRGHTVCLQTTAMACDWDVMLHPGPAEQIAAASDALDLVHQLEGQMTVYRAHSELSQLNVRAPHEAVKVEPQLFELLVQARQICLETEGAFDPTSGPLIDLWRRCRREGRLPKESELAEARADSGIQHIHFDEAHRTVRFDQEGVELNLGGIGKGYAIDRAAEILDQRGVTDYLIHGGRSSVLARREHYGQGGWPVGIRNPLFPDRDYCTLLMKDIALSTSGTAVQWFRHEGKRYGHILDPRTGWPVEGMLSVSVLAPTAALADALSTAFFVLGLEKSLAYCNNHPEIGVLLIPPPRHGQVLEPVVRGIPAEALFFHTQNNPV